MASYKELDDRVTRIVLLSRRYNMEEAVLERHDLTRSEVCLELDHLGRPSQIALKQYRPGHYTMGPGKKVATSTR